MSIILPLQDNAEPIAHLMVISFVSINLYKYKYYEPEEVHLNIS